MSSERTPIWLPGLMFDGSGGSTATRGVSPRVNYDRLCTELDLFTNGDAPVANCQFQLTLDTGSGPVTQAGLYSILAGLIRGENNVDAPNGLFIPALSFPGIVCVQSGGGADVMAWLTSTVQSAISSTDPWVFPTVFDLRTRISDPEYDAFADDILQLENGDPVPAIIDEIVNEVRGAVSRGGYIMGLEGSIPKELLMKALTLMKYEFFNRVSTLKTFAASVKDEANNVRKFLDDYVSSGKTAVSQPTALMTGKMQSGGNVESTGTRRYFSRRRQDGLT